ncbi:hypothetical protein D6C79_07332 [Aureobasidium pullulans]|nr:hypothetical protein D6C79_07332 [Aureobasidium pullulans]
MIQMVREIRQLGCVISKYLPVFTQIFTTTRTMVLNKLPTAIISNIARRLSARSAACLSLTYLKIVWERGFHPEVNHCGCKQRAWPPCPPLEMVNHEEYLFLQILARDLRGRQLCDVCQKFQYQHTGTSEDEQPTRHTCPSTSRIFSIASVPNIVLHFQDVQRVMNKYRSGEPFEAEIRSISTKQNWAVGSIAYPWSDSPRMPQITKLDIEPNVINGNLIIHTRQHVLVTDAIRDELENRVPDFTLGRYVVGSVRACSHYGCSRQIIEAIDKAVTGLESTVLRDPMACTSRRPFKCPCCLTEATLAIYHHPEQGFEIILRTWTNLGPCEWGYQVGWRIASLKGYYKYTWTNLDRAIQQGKASLGYPSEHDHQWVNTGARAPPQAMRHPLWSDPSIGLEVLIWIIGCFAWIYAMVTRKTVIDPYITSDKEAMYFRHTRSPVPSQALLRTTRSATVQARKTPEFQPAARLLDDPPTYRSLDAPPAYETFTSPRVTEIRQPEISKGGTSGVSYEDASSPMSSNEKLNGRHGWKSKLRRWRNRKQERAGYKSHVD